MSKSAIILEVNGRQVPCQDISASVNSATTYTSTLKVLAQAWAAVELYTGYQWKATSFIRQSPNHKTGFALDIAPAISNESFSAYAVSRGSDPVLYKRAPLIRALQTLARNVVPDVCSVGIFIEPDHLHLQLFQQETIKPEIRIGKWKIPKPIYSDTYDRMKLPMTETGFSCDE